MKKLKAIYNAVIVKPVELEDEIYGNIIVPDLGNEKNKTGEVVSVGEGVTLAGIGFLACKLQVGDIVVLPTMGFTKFEYQGEEYWIGPENQVLAVLEEENQTEENPF
jgi:co-chaperonin GroES (HSP10)